jgi:hypothetical protein
MCISPHCSRLVILSHYTKTSECWLRSVWTASVQIFGGAFHHRMGRSGSEWAAGRLMSRSLFSCVHNTRHNMSSDCATKRYTPSSESVDRQPARQLAK